MNAEQRILTWLERADFDGTGCRWSQENIAQACGCSRRTVIRATKKLADEGRIHTFLERRPGCKWPCRVYRVKHWNPHKRAGVLNVLRSIQERRSAECHTERTATASKGSDRCGRPLTPRCLAVGSTSVVGRARNFDETKGSGVNSWRIIEGDCRDVLATLPAESAHTCVTSPPYFGLRDYGADGQIGLEPTPDEFVAALVAVFREVRRVLRDDGTVWLNLGDSYAATSSYQAPRTMHSEHGWKQAYRPGDVPGEGGGQAGARNRNGVAVPRTPDGAKPKDLLGIPWMVAFALRADGWYLRSDIIWHKPNPMPESVTDRPTKAHEYVFLLSKGPRYFYDADAIREPLADANAQRTTAHYDTAERYGAGNGGNGGLDSLAAKMRAGTHAGANKRSVWSVATQPFSGRALAGGSGHTVSPDCPVHGARARRERAERDGARRGASPAPRNPRTESHPEQASLLAPHAIAQGQDADPADGPSATCHSTRTSRTDVQSEPRGTADAPSAGRTECTPSGLDLGATTGHMTESRTAAGCAADAPGSDPSGRTPDHSADTCTCPPIVDHFAVFPPKLIEPCILAGCIEGGTVLDPFAGSGTTGMVALRHNRSFVGVELSPVYAAMARWRIRDDAPLLNSVAEAA